MKLFLKHMVCRRCEMIVSAELEKLDLKSTSVRIGVAEIEVTPSAHQRKMLELALLKYGLEIMDDKKTILFEKIKSIIVRVVYEDEPLAINFSRYLSNELDYDYNHLSNFFSAIKGVTIEHFIISHRIERVKKLIFYDELNLTEIAFKLNYSSVAHLSNQFKKVTGLTPSFFKKMSDKKFILLENM